MADKVLIKSITLELRTPVDWGDNLNLLVRGEVADLHKEIEEVAVNKIKKLTRQHGHFRFIDVIVKDD